MPTQIFKISIEPASSVDLLLLESKNRTSEITPVGDKWTFEGNVKDISEPNVLWFHIGAAGQSHREAEVKVWINDKEKKLIQPKKNTTEMEDSFGMKTFLFSILILLCSIPIKAQFLIEDTEGRSTLLYNRNEAGTALFNSSEKKIKFNYFNYWRSMDSLQTRLVDQIATIYGSGSVENEIAKILDGNTLTPEARLGFAYGIKLGNSIIPANHAQDAQDASERKYPFSECNGDPDCETEYQSKRTAFRANANLNTIYRELKPWQAHWLYLKGEYRGSKFKLFDPGADFNDQIGKTTFNGYDIGIGYNWYHADIDINNQLEGITMILGLSVGVRRKNNLNSLTENTIANTRTFTNDTIARGAQTKITVYEGDYSEYNEPYISTDLFFIPHILNKVGILFYGRWNDFARLDRGVGIYLIKDKTNYTPKGGINIGWIDDREEGKKFQVSLVTTIGSFVR